MGRIVSETIFGPERAKLIDLCGSAAKRGMRLSLHSDYNVTPIGPLRYVSNAVTRNLRGTTQALNPAEVLTPIQALRAVTIDAAWQCHVDGIVGSLEVGKCADFVLLDRDPTQVANWCSSPSAHMAWQQPFEMDEERQKRRERQKAFWDRPGEDVMRDLTFPEEERARWTLAKWEGGFRWCRSPNVICLKKARKARAEALGPCAVSRNA